jgi:hypothetical protein
VDRSVERDDDRRVVVGWAVPAALVRPVVVEVSGVLVEDVCGVAFVVDEDPVGAFGPDAADEPFGVAVGSWCLRWNLDRRDGLGDEHGIEGRAVLGVPVADEEPERRYSVVEVGGEVAGGLRGPCHRRVGGDAEDVDAPGGDLHDEQDVKAAQPDGVEVEEVGGQQPGCLGSQECAPLGVYPARRRAQACRGQDAADGAGADVVSESGEFALDAAVSPARVLPRQPDDELTQLAADAGAARPVRVGPFLGDQASVPGQEGGGGDEAVAAQLGGGAGPGRTGVPGRTRTVALGRVVVVAP